MWLYNSALRFYALLYFKINVITDSGFCNCFLFCQINIFIAISNKCHDISGWFRFCSRKHWPRFSDRVYILAFGILHSLWAIPTSRIAISVLRGFLTSWYIDIYNSSSEALVLGMRSCRTVYRFSTASLRADMRLLFAFSIVISIYFSIRECRELLSCHCSQYASLFRFHGYTDVNYIASCLACFSGFLWKHFLQHISYCQIADGLLAHFSDNRYFSPRINNCLRQQYCQEDRSASKPRFR